MEDVRKRDETRHSALEQTRRLLEAQSREAEDANVWRALAIEARDVPMVLPIDSVLELAVCENITPVPLTQGWVRGLTNLRGQLYTVVDLSVFIGGPETRLSRDARIIMLDDDNLNTCLLVNSVQGLKVLKDQRPRPVRQSPIPEFRALFANEVDVDGQTRVVLDVRALVDDARFTSPSRVRGARRSGIAARG